MILVLAGVILIIVSFVIFKRNAAKAHVKNEYDSEIQNIVFDIGCYTISGKNCFYPDKEYPSSEHLRNLLIHSHARKGIIVNCLEEYFPLYLGIAESAGLYNPYEEKTDWVEDAVIHAEEERIAMEISEMEKSLESFQNESENENSKIEEETTEESPVTEKEENNSENPEKQKELKANSTVKLTHNADEIEASFEKEFDGKMMVDKTSKLRILEDKGEILMPVESSEGSQLIQAIGNNVTRRFYNSKLRITKKETWNISSADVKAPDSSEEYIYEEDNETISSKIISSRDECTEINYYPSGLIADLHKYLIKDEKKYTLQKRKCSYNDEGKIISDETTDYVYTDNTYKKLKYTFTKKYVYDYNEGDIPPDYKYYENGVMKMHNKYAAVKGSYTSQIYFEDELSVKAYYEDNLHVRDVYYRGSTVIREKVYEQHKANEQD